VVAAAEPLAQLELEQLAEVVVPVPVRQERELGSKP